MFRNKIARFGLAISVLACATILSTPSYALPSFARQTNKACSACHFENFPMLTDYGRAFKAGGFTEVYAPEYVRRNTDAAEALDPARVERLLLRHLCVRPIQRQHRRCAGSAHLCRLFRLDGSRRRHRCSSAAAWREYVGFHSETALRPSTALSALKLPFSYPINDSMRVLVVPFGADGHGPSYGFEVLNTGATDIHLTFEHAGQTSSYSYLGIDGTGAIRRHRGVVGSEVLRERHQVGPDVRRDRAGIGSNYAPGRGIQTGKGPSANYFRGVYFVPIRGWDSAVGVQVFSGSAAVAYDATVGLLLQRRLPMDQGMDRRCAAQGHDLQPSTGRVFHPWIRAGFAQRCRSGVAATTKTCSTIQDRAARHRRELEDRHHADHSYSLIPYKLNLTAGIEIANNGSDKTSPESRPATMPIPWGWCICSRRTSNSSSKARNCRTRVSLTASDHQRSDIATGIKQQLTFKLIYDL